MSDNEEDSLSRWNLGLRCQGSDSIESDELGEAEGPASGSWSYGNAQPLLAELGPEGGIHVTPWVERV